jgi:DNA-directed RNA polymerase subunit RPC12/RpoP
MNYYLCPRCQFRIASTKYVCSTCGFKVAPVHHDTKREVVEPAPLTVVRVSFLSKLFNLDANRHKAVEAPAEKPLLS